MYIYFIHVRTYTYTCLYIHLYAYTSLCGYIHIYVYTYIYMNMCICIYIRVYIYICIHIIYTFIYLYIGMYFFHSMHVCACDMTYACVWLDARIIISLEHSFILAPHCYTSPATYCPVTCCPATHNNTLQYTASRAVVAMSCNTLYHTTKHCLALQYTTAHWNAQVHHVQPTLH